MKIETFYTNKKIKKTTIALISDLHYTPNYKTNILIDLIKQIKKGKPNYICIVGDILDDSKYIELEELKNFFKELTYIAPVYVVIGNHDEKTYINRKPVYLNNPIINNILKQIKEVHLLTDTSITINNITFYGFNPSYEHYIEKEKYDSFVEETKKLKGSLNQENYNIILCHSPINIYTFIKKNKNHFLSNADLILSGHMHNGCLPKCISILINKTFKSSRSLISPYKKPFPKYAQGRIYKEEIDGYVSRGIIKLSKSTKLFHLLDIVFPKKVDFITIEKNK